MRPQRIEFARQCAAELERRGISHAAGIMRELIREVTKGCNPEKLTEDIGSGPGSVDRKGLAQ